MIKNRIALLKENIARICQRLGRDPAEITLVGVTKFASSEEIQKAVACGITHIGENKVQEAHRKFSSWGLKHSSVKVTKHMIGHLQTNKVKAALEIFDVIQSVDTLKLAREIEKQAGKLGVCVDIFLQVNTAGEGQKHGLLRQDVLPAIEEIVGYGHLNILGLMTMAPFVEDREVIRRCFRDLRDIRDQIKEKFGNKDNVQMKYLSMGMTHDYEIALEEGSDMVRVGRAIFGEEIT